MPVSQRLVNCSPGNWTQLCQISDRRLGLVFGCVSGDVALAINQTGPLQVTPTGKLPPGLLLSPWGGAGPAWFSIAVPVEGELTQQEWFAYPQGKTVVVGATVWTLGALSGSPLRATIVVPKSTGEVAVVTSAVSTGVSPITVTSAALGVLTPIGTDTTHDATTDQQQVDTYLVPSANGDTLTLSAAGTGTYQYGWIPLPTGAVNDTATWTTGGALFDLVWTKQSQWPTEYALFVDGGVGNATYTSETGLSNPIAQGNLSATSPDGSLFSCIVGFSSWSPTINVPPSVSVSISGALSPQRARGWMLDPAIDPNSGVVIVVIETLGEPQDTSTISFQLPALDADGQAAQRSIQRKLSDMGK